MKAYYIHWIYPASADDAVFYGGSNDLKRLFHKKENAAKYAQEYLNSITEQCLEASEIDRLVVESGYTPTPEEAELMRILWADTPESFSIYELDITFMD